MIQRGQVYDVSLSDDGNTAYVADALNGIQIINISTPASPSLIGNYNTTGAAAGVTLSSDGNTVYVADGASGLQIIDISTPASPSLIGTFNTTGNAGDLKLSNDGNTVYVADSNEGLRIIDVTATYPSSYIALTAPLSYNQPLLLFQESLGAGNQAMMRYQLVVDGAAYYFDGVNWVAANAYTQTNTAADINQNITTFHTVSGFGQLGFKAFFTGSNGDIAELDKVTFTAALPSDDFVIQVKTDNAGTSSNTQFTIPTTGSGYNYNVDCNNDGFNEATNQTGDYTCDFNNLANGVSGGVGTYTVRIKDNTGVATGFPRIHFDNGGDRLKIISLDQWGASKWTSMEGAFFGAENMVVSPTAGIPDLAAVDSMSIMFTYTNLANPVTTNWNTSNVSDMAGMFWNALAANPDTTNWNTAQVTNMGFMFYGASAANPNTSNWVTSMVFNMASMFRDATSANPDTSSWDISNVTIMNNMFSGVTLPSDDYDTMLIGFNNQTLSSFVNFHGGNSTYCNAAAAMGKYGYSRWLDHHRRRAGLCARNTHSRT